MAQVTHTMKLSRTPDEEVQYLKDFLNEIENFGKELKVFDFRNIDIEDDKDFYKILYPIFKQSERNIEDFTDTVFQQFDKINHGRVLFNLSTLLDNCADKELSHLDFNKDIKKGFEVVELLEQITKHFETAH